MSSDNKRAILAVVISGLILFGWQHFFAPKNTSVIAPVAPTATNTAVPTEATAGATTPAISPATTVTEPVLQTSSSYTLKNGNFSFTVNNGLEIEDATNSNVGFSYKETVDGPKAFNLLIEKNAVFAKQWFNLTQVDEKTVTGSNDELGVKLTLGLEANGKLNYSLISSNPLKYRVVLHSTKKELEGGHIREFSLLGKSLEKVAVGKTDEGEEEIKWIGIDFNFHIFAVTFKERKLVTYQAAESGDYAVNLTNPTTALDGSIIFAKKDYDLLTSLGDNLDLALDYGIWAFIAVPILRGLQFFYKYIPNYGIAIILLTFVIRLLTFPLQYKSFKSMKKMQELQPELTKLREKYKEEPQKLQKETMDLFKKAGANPLGGCLPLLLQMPIFFAFYKVLFNSTELMGAPFFGWITDLSHKDPFYVLPVLMAASMFLQQKMTPSPSADPTQQKIMMFMPLIFGLIMKDLPSGLTLYIFVSTIMGIAQQYLVYKKA